MRWLILFAVTLLSAEQPNPPAPDKRTWEEVKAENAKLKEQIAGMQKAFVLEMRIRDGALQACREAALQPTEKPKPSVP